jgi:hypothetical protein
MADFAEPYAARVIAIMLGIAEEEWRTIAAESATVGLAMGVRAAGSAPRRGGKLASRQREHRPRSAPYCLYRRSAGQVSLR